MAFLAYYLHWPKTDILGLDHLERRRWCRKVSEINKKLGGEDKNRIEFK